MLNHCFALMSIGKICFGQSCVGRTATATVIALVIGFVNAQLCLAADSVVVKLRDGRSLIGAIDARTNDSDLWLRMREASIIAWTSVRWDDVITAKIGSRTISGSELKRLFDSSKLSVSKDRLPLEWETPKTQATIRPAKFQFIEISAAVANWNSTAETDGIELRIVARDANDAAVPVNGSVTVRLLGRRIISNERLESRSGMGFWNGGSAVRELRTPINTSPYVEAGRWSERLRPSQVQADGSYVVRLPFRNLNPNDDLDLVSDAQVNATLNAGFQGICDASTPIELRPYSPMREHLQLYRRNLFFPDEYRDR